MKRQSRSRGSFRFSELDSSSEYDSLAETLLRTNEDYDAFTVNGVVSVIVGVIVGGFLCFSNTYFGLQTGWVTMGSLQSSLLGFGIFKLFTLRNKKNVFGSFSPMDNVLLQTTAVAAATMPLAGGFVGIIPAFNKLDEKRDGVAPFELSATQMIVWALALCFFGVFFAVPLRKQAILREKLKFPSGTATAQMIRVLHKCPPAIDSDDEDAEEDRQSMNLAMVEERSSLINDLGLTEYLGLDTIMNYYESSLDEGLWKKKWTALGVSFAASAVITLIFYFIPISRNLPIGTWIHVPAMVLWGWNLTPSLSYVGQGMIMGLHTNVSMLLGAITGWAILGPISVNNGWSKFLSTSEMKTANSIQKASQPSNWILWIALSILVCEAVTGLLILTIKVVRSFMKKQPQAHDPALPHQQVPTWAWVSGLFVSCVLCVVLIPQIFSVKVLWYLVLFSLFLSFIVSILAVKSLGETDLNPVSGVGKISQILVSFLGADIVTSLVSGAIAEAGASQAGDLMQDLKTAHLLRASPRAMFIGQLIGSIASIFFSVGAYKMYASIHTIGTPPFTAPTANLWLDTARALRHREIPHSVIPFCLAFGIIGGLLPIIHALVPEKYKKIVHRTVPNGIAFAIGMYITPNWTIPRFLGALINVAWKKGWRKSHVNYMIIVASGFVLGEGMLSIMTAGLKAAGAPVWNIGMTSNDSSSPGGH